VYSLTNVTGTAYHSDFDERVRYNVEAMPEDPDGQVYCAIRKMLQYIREDSTSPEIQGIARQALESGDPVNWLWSHIKNGMKFRQDIDIARELPIDHKEDTVEVFIRPIDQAKLIQLRGVGVGDCDCHCLYGASVLSALGIPCALVTVAADKDEPKRLSHVYTVAYLNGQRLALDFSHGPRPGWECPNQGRLIEWPVQASFASRAFEAGLAIALAAGAYFGIRWFARRAA